MNNLLKQMWTGMKDIGETIGSISFILGIMVLFAYFFTLVLPGLRTEGGLLGASLGLLSVGLGFIAVGMTAKSDKRYIELLERVDRNVARLPLMLKGDVLTPSGHLLAKEMLGEQSRIAAQKRLDEDTKRVEYVRGELYQLDNGSWGIHWGGKHPL